MNHFSLTIEAVTDQIADLTLAVWAAFRVSAQTLYAVLLILSLTEVAYELNGELFT